MSEDISPEDEHGLERRLKHPCFPQPQDPMQKVWRYLDLAKFIWLLSQSKLSLCRLDLLGDPHEGTTPRMLAVSRDIQMRRAVKDFDVAGLGQLVMNVRRATYVSCWHLGNAESEAMWRLYCGGNQGVAIQTTYESLARSISRFRDLYIGKVKYIDYETEWFPANNLLYPVMHKRISFAHEQEVRIVELKHQYIDPNSGGGPAAEVVEWDFEQTIDSIYINPYAPAYYHDVVNSILRSMAPALLDRASWSRMRSKPTY